MTSPSAATATAAIPACGSRFADDAAPGFVCGAAVSNVPSRARLTSPMSRTRCLRSFCKQRRSTVTTLGGTVAGSAVQSGSLFSTDASTCDSVSPVKTGRPVSISRTTTPKDHTSLRLSTGRADN